MSTTVGGVNVRVVYTQDVASYKKVLAQIKQLSSVGVSAGKSVSKSMTAVSSSMKTMNTHISKSTSLLKTITTTMKSMLGFFVLNKLVQFGNSAIELASDLEEVQNVVDTTFGSMAHEVDAFARSTLESFGLSELATKRYMGTLGAMLKSMGASTEKAYEMSKGLTQLSGDIASFYNLSGGEAFEKIRSGISGETEPLKALGLNLSVANLEAFALSRGITKSFNAMTEMEKATLRYNYLLSVTADAQGDFARTGEGWANQTRLLAENFNILKGILGEGFIAALRPMVVLLNSILLKLQAVATVFTNFIKKLTGWQEEVGGSLGNVVDGTSDVEEGFNDIEKAAKKAKSQVASFDDVIMLSAKVEDSGVDNSSNNGFELDSYKTIDALNSELDKTISKLEDFLKGVYDFTLDIGFDWGSIKESLMTILNNIWTTIKNVGTYFIECSIKFLKDNSIGAVITSILSDLADLSTKIQSTMENALKNIVDVFFTTLQLAFDLVSRLLTDIGIYSIIEHIAYVFEALTSLVSSVLKVLHPALVGFYDEGLSPIVEWLGGVFVKVLESARRILDKFAAWFVENKDSIVECFEAFGRGIRYVFDGYKPLLDILVNIGLGAFELFAEVLLKVLDCIIEFPEIFEFLGVALSSGAVGVGLFKVTTLIQGLIASIPTLGSIITSVTTAVSGGFTALWGVLSANPIGAVVAVVGLLIGAFVSLYKNNAGFKEFIDKLWLNIKEFCVSVWEGFVSFADALIQGIADLLSNIANGISDFINGSISFFKNLCSFLNVDVAGAFKFMVQNVADCLSLIAGHISLKINQCIDNFKGICTFIKSVFVGDFEGAFESVKDSVLRNLDYMLNGIVNFVNFAIEQINKLLSKFSSVKIPTLSGVNLSGTFSGSTTIGVRPRYSAMTSYDVALASGGVVSSPTKALIGEAGAEAVIPLENSAFIDRFADVISSKLGGASNITIKVDNLYGDDAYLTEFVRKMKRVMQKENMRFGV